MGERGGDCRSKFAFHSIIRSAWTHCVRSRHSLACLGLVAGEACFAMLVLLAALAGEADEASIRPKEENTSLPREPRGVCCV